MNCNRRRRLGGGGVVDVERGAVSSTWLSLNYCSIVCCCNKTSSLNNFCNYIRPSFAGFRLHHRTIAAAAADDYRLSFVDRFGVVVAGADVRIFVLLDNFVELVNDDEMQRQRCLQPQIG